MKIKNLFFLLLLMCSSDIYFAQLDYTLGISAGTGLNIYKNNSRTDKNHFKFNNTFSASLGVKVLKPLNETNILFVELLYTRKKIELEYILNEIELPFVNKEIVGQKYDCISINLGYRKNIILNRNSLYLETSAGVDINNNEVVYNKGDGESLEGLTETIFYENYGNTNLGENSITLSANIGAGYNFGSRNQYDAGIYFNIPMQSIQTEESTYLSIWKYQNKEYIHKQNYIGKIFYPSIKLTYYIF